MTAMPSLACVKYRMQTALTRAWFCRRRVRVGSGCIFSRRVRIVGGGIEIGSGVRVDEGCILVGSRDGRPSVRIGDNVHLWRNVLLDSATGSITIGSDVSIGSYTEIYGHGGCDVGDDCQIAGHCYIIPANHRFDDPTIPIRKQGTDHRGVSIGDDCWLGHGVSVLDGVTIGRGSVIGARAVVTSSLPAFSVAVGAPARVVSRRGERGAAA